MSGSVYGNVFKITTWGESHGKGLGVVIDGCPAGLPLTEEDIQIDLDRRKPGSNKYVTPRKEDDRVEIMSGVFEGKTTGTPISLMVRNSDHRSKDYSHISEIYRPGHADFCYDQKYGFRDYRGGGRSSGRETLARVAAGAVAKKILAELKIKIMAYTLSIGDLKINMENFEQEEILENPFAMPDYMAALKAETYLDEIIAQNDSVGGVIECQISGLKAGIGEPVFDKLDASLAKGVLSIGAVKGIEFGLGFKASKATGSFNNDEMFYDEQANLIKYTNNSGGILGGISDGTTIIFRAAVKPTPSISKEQKTITKNKTSTTVNIKGRHDPVIVPRAVVVVEAMTALTLIDLIFMNMFSKIDNIKKYYE